MVPYDVWAEIDLDALANNIRRLKGLLNDSVKFMAVVKADAYGHGAVACAKRAIDAGADALGVARLGEALELRHAGIDAPLLILGKTRPQYAGKLLEYDLTQTVCAYGEAADLSAFARSVKKRITVHIKIDTGMGRLGMLPDGGSVSRREKTGFGDAVDEICAVCRLDGLVTEGVYTHFAAADEADKTMTLRQLAVFNDITGRLEKKGHRFGIRHAANSAALIDMPETHMDMVRPGIAIYGHYPSSDVDHGSVGLTPAMTLKSRIVHLKTVGPGFTVSYGATARTVKETALATIAVGYADGFSRLLSSTGKMMIRGTPVPVIGRVCMDYTMVDVSDVPGVATGDEAILFGNPEAGAISADWVARRTGTINYEVLTGVTSRVKRIYL